MKTSILLESGIAFQLGATATVAQAATLAARRSTMGFRSHLTARVQRAGGCSQAPGTSNQVPCRDDLKCTAGSIAAKGAWRAG
ncbi:hypothetical protein PTKU46_94050 [Paraburkholderia terrae]